ncbi:MAG: hypothetical protein R3B91_05815 [Planctomycetaceae bacterium]
MSSVQRIVVFSAVLLLLPLSVIAQEEHADPPAPDGLTVESARETAEELAAETKEKVNELAQQVDQNPQAHEVSAGLLQPIYSLAEAMSIPSFHWIAFTFMMIGVVSYALQLVLGKLVLLSKMSFSIKEILSDSVGFIISLIGLVLTTQAAAENSTFTSSPAAVLSAAGIGLVMGFIFYLWGQSQEVDAAIGRRAKAKVTS